MPIISTDIQALLSGGAGNSDPNSSLGGVISSTAITDASLHNLFDQVSSAEAAAGDTEYRCFYFKNNHGSITGENAVVWIDTNTPATDTTVEIALAGEGVNGTAETVANESTAPVGETFTAPASKGAGLSVGNIPAGQHIAVWVKRIITAAAAANNLDNAIIRIEMDTSA